MNISWQWNVFRYTTYLLYTLLQLIITGIPKPFHRFFVDTKFNSHNSYRVFKLFYPCIAF